MRRAPVSIVILAWNAWRETQACLESLRSTLGATDEVIVVDNGSRDETPSRLSAFPWVKVVTNEENRGFAGGCNQGAALAEHDLVVFLNNDTVLTGHWIDALVAPFAEAEVGATGPRSNFVSGGQLVEEATYPAGDRRAMREFARAWSQAHRGETSEVPRLVGFCLAVRRSAFTALGGFDEGYEIGGFEDDDLCRRLLGAGWRLVLAHGSFVHHAGHKTFDANKVDWFAQQTANQARFQAKFAAPPVAAGELISACVLAEEGAEALPACLSSLQGVADEIVVCDLGATDDVAETALAHGAAIVRPEPGGSLAEVRNAALEACRGRWVLSLSADEQLHCDDPATLRRSLEAASTAVEGALVPVEHLLEEAPLEGAAPRSFTETGCRLFRRAVARWQGPLGERLRRHPEGGTLQVAAVAGVRLSHAFHPETARVPSSGSREPAIDGSPLLYAPGLRTALLARSALLAGQPGLAVEAASLAGSLATGAVVRRFALRTAVEALLASDDPAGALRQLPGLRAASSSSLLPDLTEARILRRLGQHRRALELLEKVADGGTDEDGLAHDPTAILLDRAESLVALGRGEEAAGLLLAAVPGDHLSDLLAQVVARGAEHAGGLLEACFEHFGEHRLAVLAAGSVLARTQSVEGALRWAARLREQGLRSACPLVTIALDRGRDPLERARACAVGYAAFGDREFVASLPLAFAVAGPAQRAAISAEVAVLAPDLVSAGASTGAAGVKARRVSPAAAPRVSIVIPCWNKAEYTVRCLKAIEANTEPGSYEVILVDNGSTDATSGLSSRPEASFTVLRNPTNLGYARASNQGAAAARTDLLVFLNNDTEVLPGWLPPLENCLEQLRSAAAVGARLLYPDGSLQHAGVELRRSPDGLLDGYHRFAGLEGSHGPALARTRLRAVTGAAMAFRNEVFSRLGGFDEAYWNGNEDVDLCLRAGEAGWQVVYEPASCIVHHESVSGQERWRAVTENRLLLSRRWQEKVLPDEQDPAGEPPGLNLVADFSPGPNGEPSLAERVVESLEQAGARVVTTALAPGVPSGFRHRLGPLQRSTVVLVPDPRLAGELGGLAEWGSGRTRVAVWTAPPGDAPARLRAVIGPADESLTLPGSPPEALAAGVLTSLRRLAASAHPGHPASRTLAAVGGD